MWWWFNSGSRRPQPAAAAAVSSETTSGTNGRGLDWDPHGLASTAPPLPLSRLDGKKRYKVSDLTFLDRRSRTRTKDADPMFDEMPTLRPGGVYTTSQLRGELNALASSGLFDHVTLQTKPNPDGTVGLVFSYAESEWPAAQRFNCINVAGLIAPPPPPPDDMTAREKLDYHRRQEREYRRRQLDGGSGGGAKNCILPETLRREVEGMVRKEGKVSSRMPKGMAKLVERWYHGEGFDCAQVVGYGNLDNSGEVVCEVVEGDITSVEYHFLDKLGNVVEGDTNISVIDRELPEQLRPGHIYNNGAGKQALNNIHSLGLFSSVELQPRPDETNQGGVVVAIKLKEQEPKSAQLATGWSIVPGCQGRPTLASIQPGGTLSFEHRNISGLNRSLVGSVTSGNLLNPEFNLHDILAGIRMIFCSSWSMSILTWMVLRNVVETAPSKFSFNTRKLSPTFVAGPKMYEAPPIWVDRVGLKANITESLTRQSKFTYGLVVEEITTRDHNNNICTHGSRELPDGTLSMTGPPTTFSGTGVDRMAFLQANITRDNTEFVNGATIGDRCIFQVDQGLGIGSKNPFFNRHQLTATKFINLNKQKKGSGKSPPAVLALHGLWVNWVLPEIFLRRVATEVSMPITVKNKHAQLYAIAEHGTDLGSSKDVKGNPTEFFRRAGHGSSYGVGVKLGAVRAEFAVDHNAGTGSFSLRFGERF
uniref:Bacterial surface antigen (D15) domain-containing protein n=1 Tax=Leersia perrieri TaxID=77586 RepID=A0A0D9XW90_9ORYZ